jgi:hypothetical protein
MFPEPGMIRVSCFRNGRLSKMGLSGSAMRFLLVLLAMLSGLSLADVAVATSPAEVVGRAELAAAEVAPVDAPCPVRARMARVAVQIDTTRPLPPHEAGFAISCGTTIADRPHE